MTIKNLKEIINTLPEETIVLIDTNDIYDAESISVQYHLDGRVHMILSIDE